MFDPFDYLMISHRSSSQLAKKCAVKVAGPSADATPRPETGSLHPVAAAISSFDLLKRGAFS
jgi:hypothetical protein